MSDIISNGPVTTKHIDNITDFAKEYSRIDAMHFVEWAFREGWRQRNRSTNWYHPEHGFGYSTEQVYSLFENRDSVPADVQPQNHLA